jgi:hypothetical protein
VSIYRNSATALDLPPEAPDVSRPLVRPLVLPPEIDGRAYTAGQVVDGLMVVLFVAANGHWWRSDDPSVRDVGEMCRGCGTTAYLLSAKGKCPHPPSQQDIATALVGRSGVSA